METKYPHERPLNFTSICLVDSSSLVCPPSGGLVFVKPKTWMVSYLLLFKSHNSFFINKLSVKWGLNFVCWFIISKSSRLRSTIYSLHIPYAERSCKFSDELTGRKKNDTMKLSWSFLIAVILLATIFTGTARKSKKRKKCTLRRSFKIDSKGDQFLKDGKPFRFISGDMHYFRITTCHWRDRFTKIKYAGLNAVATWELLCL